MQLEDIVVIDGDPQTIDECLNMTGSALFDKGYVKRSFVEACQNREKEFPTGLPCIPPVAIPHAEKEHVIKDGICMLRLQHPISFRRMDDASQIVNTNLVINLAITDGHEQISTLQKLMKTLSSEEIINCYIHNSAEDAKNLLYKEIISEV